MSKYKEAYKAIVNRQLYVSKEVILEAERLILELVDKAIPIQPLRQTFKRAFGGGGYIDKFFCPKCKLEVEENEHHCPCGQTLEWSDEE